ncbi:hypothetical protein ASG90_07500 [Nocardioides sp. Soil797]|nr:hypothetical protein ASG90_07500 [Nocardioides sp. Soil797]
MEVSDSALEAPASMTQMTAQGAGISAKLRVVTAASTRSIPAPALAAYQRAASVINASDPSCRIDWELIAAIARVESDHGQHAGSTLDANGIARPAIIGVALNGHGTARIDDTDAGQYDNDKRHDRAVGPLQFIPSTWSVVGVDADGDGVRNPQDIDDAALAAAVYLCSGNDDLSTASGRNSAVFRYNHSQSYVSVVLDLMGRYVAGNFAATPTTTPVSASTAVETNLVGTTPADKTEPATQGPKAGAWAVVKVDKVRGPSGGILARADGGTFTETAPTTPGEPTDPTTPTDPPETGGPDDPEPPDPGDPTTGPGDPTTEPRDPSESTGPDDPSTCAVDEETEAETPEDELEPSPTEASELPQQETDETDASDESTVDPEDLPEDDPCTPDIDESDPSLYLPSQTPGEEAVRPVS